MIKRILSFILAFCLCVSFHSVAYAGQKELPQQEDIFTAVSASGSAARDSTVPTPTEAYESMIALKSQDAYKEGTPWTNDVPYSSSKGYGSLTLPFNIISQLSFI